MTITPSGHRPLTHPTQGTAATE